VRDDVLGIELEDARFFRGQAERLVDARRGGIGDFGSMSAAVERFS
jgi:hypothetical protein